MADGASYEGAFAADKRHGLDAYTYANGDTYSMVLRRQARQRALATT